MRIPAHCSHGFVVTCCSHLKPGKRLKVSSQQGQPSQAENADPATAGHEGHSWSSDEDEEEGAAAAVTELEAEVQRLHEQVGRCCTGACLLFCQLCHAEDCPA